MKLVLFFTFTLLCVTARSVEPNPGSCLETLAPLAKPPLNFDYVELPPMEFLITFEKNLSAYRVAVVRRFVHESSVVEVLTTELRPTGATELIATKLGKMASEIDIADALAKEAFKGLGAYMALIKERVKFAIGEDEKRGHFNWRSRKAIQTWGERHPFQSKYITVFEKNADATAGEIFATLRLISAPYIKSRTTIRGAGETTTGELVDVIRRGGSAHDRTFSLSPDNRNGWQSADIARLPEEVFLSEPGREILFERPAEMVPVGTTGGAGAPQTEEGPGEVLAPGLWAIRKSQNPVGFVLTIGHLLNFAVDTAESAEYNTKSKLFYTIADKPQLYTALGFKPASYFKRSSHGWEMSSEPVDKQGHSWHVLAIDAKGLANIITKLKETRGQRYNDVEIERIERFVDRLIGDERRRILFEP